MIKCFVISGRVQGVGFRYWAVRQARSVGGISGYIRNLENGDVAVYMSGDEAHLNQMQILLYKGPLFARVDSVRSAPEQCAFFPPIVDGVFQRL